MNNTRAWLGLFFSVGVVVGCGGEDGGPLVDLGVSAVRADSNPYNQLSSTILFNSFNVDSARVVYWEDGGQVETTPFYQTQDGANRIVTLGLRPVTTYLHSVEAVGVAGTIITSPLEYTTGELPEFLQSVSLEISGNPPPGNVFACMSNGGYVVVFDEQGAVRWYRSVTGYVGRDAGQKPNGNYVAFVGTTTGHSQDFGYYVEFKPSGEEVRLHTVPAPLHADNHELLLTTTSSGIVTSHIFSYEFRTIDLSSYGGPSDARIAGHQILRTTGGIVEYTWDAWDVFSIFDAVEEPVVTDCTECDFDHPNSLDFDLDGNYIASFRDMSEITKIDYETGDIIWRMGGNNNQFTFVNDPEDGFSAQHYARIQENGNLVVYDNGTSHDQQETRVVEYELDTTAMTATLVWEYRHTPPIYTPFVGTAQRLRNGNTFVGFGWETVMVEVEPGGDVVWEGILKAPEPIRFYRVQKIVSLYEFIDP